VHESTGTWPTVHVFCTNPAAHVGADDGDAARQAQVELDRQEREARRAAAAAAMTARVGVLVDLLGTSVKLPPTLRDLVRGLLPQMIGHIDLANWDEAYAIALSMHEDDRWDLVTGYDSAAIAKRATLRNQHVEELATASDAYLSRALIGMLVGFAESNVDALWSEADPIEVVDIRSYYALLGAAGHVLTEHDKSVHDTLAEAEAHNAKAAS